MYLTVNLNLLLLSFFLIAVAFTAGLLMRVHLNKKLQKRVYELENEMINNHSEILNLNSQLAKMQKTVVQNTVPVITLNKQANSKTATK
jgi:uncharacterized coiled-coil protein SlyX